jgi:hypothetical protein
LLNLKVPVVLLIIFLSATLCVQKVSSITPTYYMIMMTPIGSGVVFDGNNGFLHPVAGSNVSISYQLQWGYGASNGQKVVNASVYLDVREDNGSKIDSRTLQVDDNGAFSFVYSSQNPQILHFVTTKVVDSEGLEYNSTLLHASNGSIFDYNLYGLHPPPLTVYWDSLNIASINAETYDLGAAKVIVRVQYMMIPDDSQVYSKDINEAIVTVNGVNATPYEGGVGGFYTVSLSTWSPNLDLTVQASLEGWPTATKTYSTAQVANRTLYFQIGAAVLITVGLLVAVYAIIRRRKLKK